MGDQNANPSLPLLYQTRGAKKRERRPTDSFLFFRYTLDRTKQKGGKKMHEILIHTLYIDPQDILPSAFCPHCGGERYAPSLVCLRCERRGL